MHDMLESALAYARRGWAVFPCTKDKKPCTPNGYKDAVNDETNVRALFARFPGANIGIATGRGSNLVVLDVDIKNGAQGEESLAGLINQHGSLPHTVESITWSGGRQLYFEFPDEEIRNSAGKLGPGLDIRGEGGYVIAPPSVVNGKAYAWEISSHPDESPLAVLPEWLKTLILTPQGAAGGFSLPEGAIPQGEQDSTLFKLACSLKEKKLPKEAVRAALMETIKTKCRQDTRDPFTQEDVERWIRGAFKYPDKPASAKPNSRKPWQDVSSILQADPVYAGVFRYDQFAEKVNITRICDPLPITGIPKELDDDDVLMIKGDLSRRYKIEPATRLIDEAVRETARRNPYHPILDWLDSLKWDGQARLHTWMIDYLNAEDTPYTRAVSTLMLVGACARVLKPGCKLDYLFILEGEQGIGKSHTAAILGGEWWVEIEFAKMGKDLIHEMLGKWFCEFSELSGLYAREVESIKHFLSKEYDRTRLSYERHARDYKRKCIFIGTINKNEYGYLRDTTGNRRFLPVECNGPFDLNGLRLAREQLFAEAYYLAKQGYPLYLSKDLEPAARAEQAKREEVDPWIDPIREYVEPTMRDSFKTIEIWTEAIKGQVEQLGRVEQMRIAKCLRTLGYEYKGFRPMGADKTVWIWMLKINE